MNGLKIRKLAAVVAGGALLGAAAAPMVSAITSAEAKSVVYNADMSPVVNVVVGGTAAVSDGVWAGNIARAIVANAMQTKTYTGGGAGGSGTAVVTDLAAVLSLGGTVTVTGGKTFNNVKLNSVQSGNEYEQSIGKDPLSFLTEKTISYKYNDSSSNIDVKETVGVQLDADFSQDSDVKDLILNMDAADVNFLVNLGAGIPSGDTAASTADFVDGANDNIRIPFFGKTFLVQKVDIDSSRIVSELRLIEDKAKQTFVAGESFTMPGIGDYAGQTLTVTVVSVVATGPAAAAYQAKFNVTDEAGNLIDTQTQSAGNFVEFEDAQGDDVVSGDIYLDTASVTTGTNEGTVDLLVGTSSVRLKDGENYPYREDADAENINGPYVVQLGETTDTNKLTSILIRTRDTTNFGTPDTTAETVVAGWGKSVFDVDNPMYSKNNTLVAAHASGPNSFKWLNGTGALGEGLFTITFNGFKAGEELSYVQIGNNELEFRDSADTLHRIPFWVKAGSETGNNASTAGSTQYTTQQNNSNGVTFPFDGGNKTLYYDVNTLSTDFNVANGTVINGVAIVLNATNLTMGTDLGSVDINSDAPTAVTINGVTYLTVSPSTNATQVTLRADGYVRFGKAQLNSSTATSDFLAGLAGATAPIGPTGLMTTANLANVFFYDDANINSAGTAGIGYGPLLSLSGDSYSAAYSFFVNEGGTTINGRSASKGLFLGLLGNITNANTTGDGQAIPTSGGVQNSKQLTFYGTDTGENMGLDANWYIPQRDDWGFDSSTDNVLISWFGVDENNASDYQSRIYIDNRDDEIPQLGGTGNKISSPGSDVNYGRSVAALSGQTFSLSTDTSSTSSLVAAFSDFGTKISIADGETAQFWIPENRTDVEIIVTGASTTQTVTGGEEITVKEGETGSFSAGTQITVKDITYTATVEGGDGSTSPTVTSGGAFTYKTLAPLNGKAQVFTTNAAPAGPKVIVGGHLVNTLAQGIADRLNAPGDVVSEVVNGNIVVAGYTAEDTGTAAAELIDALDAI